MINCKTYRTFYCTSYCKYNHKTAPLVLLLVAGLMLAGCGSQETPAPTAVPAAAVEQAPAAAAKATAVGSPLAAPASPLGTPLSPLPAPAMKAEPTAETGVIVGRILIRRPAGEIAVADMIIGLASVVRDENGVAKVSGYEPSQARRVSTDAYGRFIMNNINPGTYTLILDAIVQQYQLTDEKTGYTILVDVKAGEINDLGTLTYSSLPLPGFN